MIEKLKCNKSLIFSSITVGSSINTFCAEEEIVLNNNSYITVDGSKTYLEGFKFEKNKEEIKTGKDLLKYFLDNLSNLDFNDVENPGDENIGVKLNKVFNLNEHFKNNELLIYDINNLFDKIGPYNEEEIKKILNDIFTNQKLCLTLKTYQEIKIEHNFAYKLKKEFENKVEEVNKEIKTFFNIGQIKNLMGDKGFERNKISIKNAKGNEYPDGDILNANCIPVYYEDSLEPKTAEIEFIAGDDLVLDKIEKKHKIDFFKDKITKDTTIFNFITNKFKGLLGKNCKIEYCVSGSDDLYYLDEFHTFCDGDKIKITINEEIYGFTKKKVEKNKININFEVKDKSKYVFISAMNNIISLEIEKGKTYDDLITEINKYLGNDLKTGFKIYKNDKNTEFKSGAIEDNVTYIVVFDENATDFVKEKEKDNLYINLKFEVTDNTKFKLKQDVTDKDNIEIQQGKNYNDLLVVIKQHLGGRNLKEGFKIYKNDKNNEFKSGAIEDNITYIIVFDNDDTNFVDKKEEPQKPDPQKTQETTNTEQTNNDDNETTKKGGYSGKNGKYSNKK